MNIEDFLPKYPDVEKSEYNVLNPYEDDFYNVIYRKKEFYENRLQKTEEFPSERGILLKHQIIIARYLSSHTPYDKILMVHEMGSGKSCLAIGAIEQVKSENSTIQGAIIVAKGQALLENFSNELAFRCTAGQYIPDNFNKLTEGQKVQRLRKKREDFYELKTIQKFSKEIKAKKDNDLISEYSNKIIVIDEVHNLRIQPEKNKETLEVYHQYWRLLHIVKNCKILLLSGTPMKDGPEEIASVMNLILPEDEQLPFGLKGEEFLDEFMTEDDGIYSLKPDKIPILRERFKGRVSFLRAMSSDVETKYIGKTMGTLKHLVVNPDKMSKFQSQHYATAYELDRTGQKGIYNKSKEASLFVYPDGSYGSEGFNKYITAGKRKKAFDIQISRGKEKKLYKMRYNLADELVNELKGQTQEETLLNIKNYSSKYAAILEQILSRKQECSFIYSSIVHGSGSILFSLLLQLLGYTKANGKESSKSPRYAILTGDTTSKNEIKRIRERFNNPDNRHGEYIHVIIGSKTVSEGLSFNNVRFEVILTPHFNYSETAQALARGIRLGSHNDLIKAGITPTVTIMQPVSIPKSKYNVPSIDLYLYQLSEDKDISIRNILRIIMEAAFDCALNYFRNHITGKDGERECDYTTCDYKCTGVNMKVIQEGLKEKDLDYSTYQLYYTNPQNTKIRKRIEQMLRQNVKIDIDTVIKNLEKEFSEWEVRNALQTLVDQEEETEYDYRQFLEVYSRSSVQKIMKEIEKMFKQNFYLNLDTIQTQFPTYTKFETITALRTLINESVVIINRYGFPSYLKEENNVFFLVNNLSVSDNFFSMYYTRSPNIINEKTFTELTTEMYSRALPGMIRNLCKVKNNKDFSHMVKSVPIQIQELLVEAALVAEDKGSSKNSEIRKFILEYFKNYIKQIDGTWVSTLQEGDEILRCREIGTEMIDWKDCPSDFFTKLKVNEEERKVKLRQENPYGIIGKYNPENGKFCIIDFNKEEASKKRIKKKKGDVETEDTRATNPGKVCSDGGWKLPELMSIMIKRLKVNPPVEFRKTDSEEKMRKMIKTDNRLKQSKGLFTEDELDSLDKDGLRRIIYWGLPPGAGGKRRIQPICVEMRKWFEEHNLLEIDNQCGVQGKIKSMTVEKKEAVKRIYRIEQIVPNTNQERFKGVKELPKLMKECFKIDKYRYEINDDKWVMAYTRSKLVGFIVIRGKKIVKACIAKNYRRQGIPKEVMKSLTDFAKISTVEITNAEKEYSSLIRMYKTFGFVITKDDGRKTSMEYSGSE